MKACRLPAAQLVRPAGPRSRVSQDEREKRLRRPTSANPLETKATGFQVGFWLYRLSHRIRSQCLERQTPVSVVHAALWRGQEFLERELFPLNGGRFPRRLQVSPGNLWWPVPCPPGETAHLERTPTEIELSVSNMTWELMVFCLASPFDHRGTHGSISRFVPRTFLGNIFRCPSLAIPANF